MRLLLLLAAAWAASAVLGGCAGGPAPSPERIVETATGRLLTCAELAEVVRAAPVALLGEQHDQRTHHQRRGALIERLRGSGAVIVAEQLPRLPGEGARSLEGGAALLPALLARGFRAQAWDWPQHEPLFEAIAATGLPLLGGDLTPEALRQGMAPGGAPPQPLAVLVAGAPLAPQAEAALDADLQAAHGGALPAPRLALMRQAQRWRDASLFTALKDSGGRPAVLVAGNGHVRRDYGVPQLLRAAGQPDPVHVALVVPGEPVPGGAAAFSHVWTVDPAQPVRACGP